MDANATTEKGYRGAPMEGFVARRYAKLRGTPPQIATWRRQAAEWTAGLPDGATILEVAPGPGYFAVELARAGRFRVTGLDISRTMVHLAAENAAREGVSVHFYRGNAARMPFADGSFDLVACQAAFKNFRDPSGALSEMYRVLKPGGNVRIEDMRYDATDRAIHDEVAAMQLSSGGALMTRYILRRLRRRAYTAEQFDVLAAVSPFGHCRSTTSGIGIEVRLAKRGPPSALAVGSRAVG
jgi:ubiquinone/menaquinone biosynthesis C-methylase UbiE